MVVTIEKLGKLFPKVSGEVLDVVLAAEVDAGWADDLRIASDFNAQIGHESVGLTRTREIGEGIVKLPDGALKKPRYWPWFGRGYIQITWLDNYKTFAQVSGIDCVNHPELLEAPEGAIESAIWFYRSKGLNKIHDFDTISTRINGAAITQASLHERRVWHERAIKIFSA
jgi:putative chitinase